MTTETLRERQEQAIITAFSKFRGDLRLAERKALAEAFLDVLGDDGWTLAARAESDALRAAPLDMEALAKVFHDEWIADGGGCRHTEQGMGLCHERADEVAYAYAIALAALAPSPAEGSVK